MGEIIALIAHFLVTLSQHPGYLFTKVSDRKINYHQSSMLHDPFTFMLQVCICSFCFVHITSIIFLGRAVARAPISGFFRHSVILSLLASREVSREAIGIKAV